MIYYSEWTVEMDHTLQQSVEVTGITTAGYVHNADAKCNDPDAGRSPREQQANDNGNRLQQYAA